MKTWTVTVTLATTKVADQELLVSTEVQAMM